jgi:hypothetical protein
LRPRSAAELSADIAAGCTSLGALAAEWNMRRLEPHDLSTCERTIAGIQRLLVEMRLATRATA